MPRSKRGSGFSRSKRGRDKHTKGHGHGGRPKKAPEVYVGEMDTDSQSGSCTESETGSNDTSTFLDALLPSDSERSSSAMDSDLDSGKPTSGHSTNMPPLADSDTSQDSFPGITDSSAYVPRAQSIGTISELMTLLKAVLPKDWMPISHSQGVHVVLLSRGDDIAIQRNIFMKFDGFVRVTAHRQSIPVELHDEIVSKGGQPVVLSDHSVQAFVDRIVAIVVYVRSFEICAGADYKGFEHLWKSDGSGNVDNNPFDENRYVKTFRAKKCAMLVPIRKWRCSECNKVGVRFRNRKLPLVGEDFDPNTPNVLLTEDQKLQKLRELQHFNRNKDRKIDYYQKRVSLLLKTDGVVVDGDLSDCLSETLATSKLTPLLTLFIQQQQKAASCKSARGMRWHPAMIRLALLLKSQAGNALDNLRSAGLSFPSDRTLFDYSHVEETIEGVISHKIEKVYEHISKYEKSYQHFHNLLMDEIHISQKLVYLKSSGQMVGYVKLNEVEEEIEILAKKVNGVDRIDEPPVAKTMLTYMLKGVCNDVKEVIATFSANAPSQEFVYDTIMGCHY